MPQPVFCPFCSGLAVLSAQALNTDILGFSFFHIQQIKEPESARLEAPFKTIFSKNKGSPHGLWNQRAHRAVGRMCDLG